MERLIEAIRFGKAEYQKAGKGEKALYWCARDPHGNAWAILATMHRTGKVDSTFLLWCTGRLVAESASSGSKYQSIALGCWETHCKRVAVRFLARQMIWRTC